MKRFQPALDAASGLGLTIRDAAPADTASVIELWDGAFVHSGAGRRNAHHSPEEFRRFARGAEVIVAAHQARIFGVVALIDPESPRAIVAGPGELELSRLAVASAVRRRGVATSLLAACRERAVTRDAGAIVLQSLASESAAHSLYRGLGYARQPHRDRADRLGDPRLAFRLILPLRPVPPRVPRAAPGFWS